MNHSLLTLILLGCSSLALSAQPKAYFPETSHNFGAFDEDSGPVTCRFPLVNMGTDELAIISARATCGCTQPKYPREAIAPGDTAYITVSFDPGGRPGRFNKQVYIETNTTPSKTRLDISGVVIGSGATVSRRYPVSLGPIKVTAPGIMLGDVVKGRLKTVYFEGYNQSPDSVTPRIGNAPQWLDIAVAPEVVPPGEQVTFICYVNSPKCPQYGLVEDNVAIATSPAETFTLPLTALMNEDFSQLSPEQMSKSPIAAAEPDRVELGRVDLAAGPIKTSFDILNAGKSTLEIRRVYSSDPGVEVSCPQKSVKKGKRTTVDVTIDPGAATGAMINSRIVVITNDPMRPSFTVRIVGEL